MEESKVRTALPVSVPRLWQERWKAMRVGFSNFPGHVWMPRPLKMKSMSSQVRLASEVMAGSGFSSNWSRLPWRFIAAQEPEGTITGKSPAKTSAACFATLREADHSPELKAGWPQQVWSSG